jgi:outer membrane biosynthesis protein TonB
MPTSARLRLIAAIAACTLILGAGAALAASGDETTTADPSCSIEPSVEASAEPSVAESVDPSVDASVEPSIEPSVEPSEDPCNSESPEPSQTDEPSDTETPEASDDPTATNTPAADREAECNTAAGVDPSATAAPPTGEKLTGLDNAISHVLENCLKNPQAPGLANALEHLVANQERQAEEGGSQGCARRRPCGTRERRRTRQRWGARAQRRGARQQRPLIFLAAASTGPRFARARRVPDPCYRPRL